ncbi:MAG: SpoIIE family protein phosphatase [Gemmatales bacterium]|nr:SpoIIE family protein phosphatase [Gemmatales bacterium]MDW7994871.1 SpoIIE family protein phosphatase [Gemmatales bacterium]
MAALVVVRGSNVGARYELKENSFIIGRNPSCHLVVPSPAVSREHAEVFRQGSGEYYIKDLGSRNKTIVNGRTLEPQVPVRLRHKDEIRICDLRLQFLDDKVREPLPDEFRPEPAEAPEEANTTSTLVSRLAVKDESSFLFLQTQPAERFKILLDISNRISRTLELNKLLPEILDSLFQVFRQADRAFLVLPDESRSRWMVRAKKCRRAKDEENARPSRTIIEECARTGEAFLCEDASTASQFRGSESIADFTIRSVICAPARNPDGKILAVIQLDTQDRMKQFTEEDLQLLILVCNQVALALDNAALHEDRVARERLEREMEFARQVQAILLPSQLPQLPEYEFFAYYKAARFVGGDFYAVFPLPDGRWVLAVGDVAGKGVAAALLMARMTADVRYCVLSHSDPTVVMQKINESLLQAGLADRFVTLSLSWLDPKQHRLTMVNAGHLPAVLRRNQTDRVEEVASGDFIGLPLGIDAEMPYTACEVTFQPGDVLYIFSDGILDATSAQGERFGQERIQRAVQTAPPGSASQGAKHLIKAVEQFCLGQTHQHDDMTLLAIGRRVTAQA